MDLITAIALISSFISIEEAARTNFENIKSKIKKKGLNLNDWDSDDPTVQALLDRFKTNMAEAYGDFIFADSDIDELKRRFVKDNAGISTTYEERKQIEKFIEEIIKAYNIYVKSSMSVGEKAIYTEMSLEHSKIEESLDEIRSQPQNENIRKFLRAVEKSKAIELANINEFIDGDYEIDRTELLDRIKRDDNKIVSIQGKAGSGKSVLCKKLISGEEYILATRAEMFALGKTINEIWECDVEDAIKWLGTRRLYIFIDALEFIADCSDRANFSLQEIYWLAQKYKNLYVLTSCRSTDSSAFIKIDTKCGTRIYEIPELTNDEINALARKYSIIESLKQCKDYSDLLSSPFYINLILSGGFDEENINDENSLRLLIWDRILCLKDKCSKYSITQSDVKNAIENIVFTRAKKFVVGVNDDIVDSKVLNVLIAEGLIIHNESGIRLKYDIFEDICFERYIDNKFDSCSGDYNAFFEEIESMGRCIYRRYQIWISNKLFVQASRHKFIYSLVADTNISEKWKTQTEIGLVKSKYSGMFFSEYQELLDDMVFEELLKVTNLYAFEARIGHSPVLSLAVKPVGAAREHLIRIAAEPRFSDEKYRKSVIKLCDDYSAYPKRTIDTEEKACEIIIGYINSLIEKIDQEKAYLVSEDVVSMFLIVSKMARASKLWLTQFVGKMIDEYSSDLTKSHSVAEDILVAIVSSNNPEFIIALPELACKVADTVWMRKESEKNKHIGFDYNQVKGYGLSDNADYHFRGRNGVYSNGFIWNIMKLDYVRGLDWAISFVNKAVNCFAINNPDDVVKIELYFDKNVNKKSYWGNGSLWMADSMENSVPVILSDIVYILKKTLINTFSESSDWGYVKCLANYTKKTLYDKSNNILLLSIIETLGMSFERELPGYAIELASSMELIHWDISRYTQYLHNPARELLEKQITMMMGIPELDNRYEKFEKCSKSLQQYMGEAYIYGDIEVKDRCNSILDYLYSLYDERTYPDENLQIQKMDMRQATVYKIDENSLLVEPQIHGAPAELVKESNNNEPIKQISLSLDQMIKDVKNKAISTNKLITTIEELIGHMKREEFADIQFENTLIMLIVLALRREDIERKQRNDLLREWLKRVDNLFRDGTYVSNIDLLSRLWEQLDEDIDCEVGNHILRIMLDSILDDRNNGLIEQISDSAVLFLREHKKYARRIFLTIIRLAEDEMEHQKFNAEYINSNRKDGKFEFVPNMKPHLLGVDSPIVKKKTDTYKCKKESIIQNYLLDNCDDDIGDIDLDNYDIGIMCYVFRCGLDLDDKRFACVVKKIVCCMIDVWNSNKKERRVHEIIDPYKEYCVSSFFKYELDIIGRDSERVFSILFRDIDFSKFTMETVEFYRDILSTFLSSYVDGFRERGKRNDIESKLLVLEKYIEQIPEEWIRKELEKSLFFCPSRYSHWNVDKVKTEYSYKDKCFLNKQICKYGLTNVKEVIHSVYMMNIDKLLPEILISIGECFSYALSQNDTQFYSDVNAARNVIDMMILRAFVYHSEYIKKHNELIEAYETILLSLVEAKSEKAAVLLDEFRIH